MNKAMLIILDGYGEGKAGDFNAVKNAKTPTLDRLKTQSYSLLKADGEAVGLFKNDLGGSEVGHLTIGAGRIVPSMLRQIHYSIEKKTLQKNKKLEKVIAKLEKNKGDLHLIGLCSDKNIHSNINHAYAIIDIFKNLSESIFNPLNICVEIKNSPISPKNMMSFPLEDPIKNRYVIGCIIGFSRSVTKSKPAIIINRIPTNIILFIFIMNNI